MNAGRYPIEHHADFAVPVTKNMRVTTAAVPDDGLGPIEGEVIALGWWVDPEAGNDPDHIPVGTLYLVVDEGRPRPMWIRQSDLLSVHIEQ